MMVLCARLAVPQTKSTKHRSEARLILIVFDFGVNCDRISVSFPWWCDGTAVALTVKANGPNDNRVNQAAHIGVTLLME